MIILYSYHFHIFFHQKHYSVNDNLKAELKVYPFKILVAFLIQFNDND